MKNFFLKFETFYENHPPTRQLKYKKINFVPCNKSIMAKKLRFIRRIKLYRALIVPSWSKWPKWQSLNPHNFTKNDHK